MGIISGSISQQIAWDQSTPGHMLNERRFESKSKSRPPGSLPVKPLSFSKWFDSCDIPGGKNLELSIYAMSSLGPFRS